MDLISPGNSGFGDLQVFQQVIRMPDMYGYESKTFV